MQNLKRNGQGDVLMFILQEAPIDPVKAKNMCRNPANGALVVFEGVVRADEHQGSVVSELLYIADTPVCNLEGEKIIKEALAQFAITEAVCIQRIGQLKIAEIAVWIGVWAPHRDEAFKGCRYVIEEIKKRLLIWKKEFYADGSNAWIHGPQTPLTP
jgi:molybdopterin synthase catalytic subunit